MEGKDDDRRSVPRVEKEPEPVSQAQAQEMGKPWKGAVSKPVVVEVIGGEKERSPGPKYEPGKS